MKLDNPIYYEEQSRGSNEQREGSFSLVWRPLIARFFPDTEMIYWVPEYMDTLRSRKKGKEKEDNGNDSCNCELYRTSQPDKIDLNFNYDKTYNEQSKQIHDQPPTEQVLSPSSKTKILLSPLSKIPEFLSPRCTKALNNSGNSELISESPESQRITITFNPEWSNETQNSRSRRHIFDSPESQRITITFSPESVKSYKTTNDQLRFSNSVNSYTSTNDQQRISNFRSPAVARHKKVSPKFYHFDKTLPERNSINLLGRRFNCLSRQQRVVSEVTDDFIFHRPESAEIATNSPSYINPLELQRINHRQSGDPLPTPPPSSPWESCGNSGHIYWNDTKIVTDRIPEPKVLDGFLTASVDQNLNRKLDYEPLGMKVLANNSSNSAIQQATEVKDNTYRLHLRLYSCIVILILMLGLVLILIVLRVPVF